jgi:ferrous iron transport protein B
VAGVINGRIETTPRRVRGGGAVQRAVDELVPLIEDAAPGLPNARWVAMRLLDGDHRVRQALLSGELAGLTAESRAPARRASRLIALEERQ